MNVLIWFKRDLRLHDHPALALGAQMGRVLPLHVVEPERWAEPDLAGRHWEFTVECLNDLREALAQAGAPLLVRVGDAQNILERMCRQHKIDLILSLKEAGSLWERQRDQKVRAWCAEKGIDWRELDRPQTHTKAPVVCEASPRLTPLPGAEPGLLPAAKFLRLREDRCPHRQSGGRAKGLALLESFTAKRGEPYHEAAEHPILAERASSRLSPYLAQGALSPREIITAIEAQADPRTSRAWQASFARLTNQLKARDRLFGTEITAPLTEAAASLRPQETAFLTSTDPLAALRAGETGLPFIDASMRYLTSTGWLPAGMRMMLASFGCHYLGLSAHDVGSVMAQLSTDYDPGLHWPMMQAYSAQSPQTARIIDPIRMGQQLDPEGNFTRRWLPELTNVPCAHLQSPWRWLGAGQILGKRYPEPVLDPNRAHRSAKALWRPQSPSPKRSPARQMVELIELPTNRAARTGQLSLGF